MSIDRYFSFVELSSNEAFLETLSEEEFDRTVEFMTAMLRSSAPEIYEDLQVIEDPRRKPFNVKKASRDQYSIE